MLSDDSLRHGLAALCGAEGLQYGDDIAPAALSDWLGVRYGTARARVQPRNTAQVAAVLAFCHQHRLPVTPQGGNTGMSGGAIPVADAHQARQADGAANGIILSLNRLNCVRELDCAGHTITVEAGCTLAQVQEHAAHAGLFFPLTLGAKGSCQIGGNLATNAGGMNVLRYGNTRDLCLGLEAVFADGRVMHGLSALHKNNSGYDLRHLLIGSEGTLAIITAATLRLLPPPRVVLTGWLFPPSPTAALQLFNRISSGFPNALQIFEMMPANQLQLIKRYQPSLPHPYRGETPPWSVLFEAADCDEEALQQVLAQTLADGLTTDIVVASSEGERATFWQLREDAPPILAKHGGWLRADIAVPRGTLPAFIADIEQRLTAVTPGCYIIGYGHFGDGNLHIAARPLDEEPANHPKLCATISRTVYDCTAAYHGSISAEHGIGQTKTALLPRYKDPAALIAMHQIKHALDPHNLLNPGKILATSQPQH